jgi:ssDNA-binding Zn-finger/Zn-ribbon topoisomerase 1
VSFEIEEEARGPYEEIYRTTEVQVGLFLISLGFESAAEDPTPLGIHYSPSVWKRGMGFGAVIRVFPRFNSFKMEVHLGVYSEERDAMGEDVSYVSPVAISIEEDSHHWQDVLNKKIQSAVEHGLKAMNLTCPHCGGKMKERKIRVEGAHKGESFYGCSKYPQCRGARFPWNAGAQNDEGKWAFAKCPDCDAPLVIRYAKQGRNEGNRFYGCKAYPKCKRIVQEDELMALRLMQGEDAKSPWEWTPPEPPPEPSPGLPIDLTF